MVEYYLTSKRSEQCVKVIRFEIQFASETVYQDTRVFLSEDERTKY